MSATERLIALLECSASDPGVRQLIDALRRTPQQVATEFDYYQHLIEAIGAAQAARAVINSARVAHWGWLAG
jgi:hypothetical protein